MTVTASVAFRNIPARRAAGVLPARSAVGPLPWGFYIGCAMLLSKMRIQADRLSWPRLSFP